MTQSASLSIEQFMAANLFYCHLLAARITAGQCEINRARDLYLCGKCDQERATSKNAKIKRPKRHKGDNPDSPWRKQLYDRAALAEHEAEQAAVAVEVPEQSTESTMSTESTPSTKVRSGQVRSGQVRSGQVSGAEG